MFLEKLGICNQDTCVKKFIIYEYLQNQIEIVQFFIVYGLGIRVNFYIVGYYHCNTVPIMLMEGTYYHILYIDKIVFAWYDSQEMSELKYYYIMFNTKVIACA